MKLEINWTGDEKISFLNLLNLFSYHDMKMSLDEMGIILENRDPNTNFTYQVKNKHKITEIRKILNDYHVSHKLMLD